MPGTFRIDVVGRSRTELLIIADNACAALASIASQLTTDEGDKDDTEEEFGLSMSEVVEMAHDNMINAARAAIAAIAKAADAESKLASTERPEGTPNPPHPRSKQ